MLKKSNPFEVLIKTSMKITEQGREVRLPFAEMRGIELGSLSRLRNSIRTMRLRIRKKGISSQISIAIVHWDSES